MQDLRIAVRTLLSAPIVTGVAILSLTLGIGANTAIFSIIDALLLRPLPVRDPDRLVHLSTSASISYQPNFSYATFDQIRRRTDLFDGALAFSNCCGTSMLTIGSDSQPVERRFLSGDYFTTLGISAYAGRGLTPADDSPQGGPDGTAGVISYRLWQRRFNGRTSAIGAHVVLDRAPVTIVGILPPAFFGTEVGRSFDLAVPAQREPVVLSSIPFDEHIPWLNVLLRLKPGQSIAAATAALRAFQPQIQTVSRPDESRGELLQAPFTLEPAASGLSPLRDRFAQPLLALLVIVMLVVVIASANLASLQLARGIARRHDLSVRVALGASRWRLMRQLSVECVLLAGAGTVLGVAFAASTVPVIVAQLSRRADPLTLDVSTDWRVVVFAAGVMIASTFLFGALPAVQATRVRPADSLRDDGRGTIGSRRSRLLGTVLVAQVAISVALVIAAGLFLQTFERLTRIPLGFDADRVLEVTVTAPTVPAERRNQFYHQLVAAANVIPGVEHAGGSMNPPLTGTLVGDLVLSSPGTVPAPGADRVSQGDSITPGTLAAYGTRIVAGRDFEDRDAVGAAPVMLVNEALAQRLFPGRDLVGSSLAVTFRAGSDVPLGTMTVVGIVENAVFRSIRHPAEPTIYLPLAQDTGPILQTRFYLALRSTTTQPAALTRSVTAALLAINPDLQLQVRPLSDQVVESFAEDRLVAMLAGFFGVLALMLAGLGLYGVTAHMVSRRRPEFAIRVALGARPVDVVWLVIGRVSLLVAAGLAIGTAVSFWASRFVRTLVFGVDAHDPVTLGWSALVLILVAAIATAFPVYGATRLDPAAVLREQ